MFCIHIVYRGIRILHELFVNASSISLCVWFFIHIGYRVSWFFLSCLYVILKHNWLQGYHNSPRIVSMWFFKFSLCVVMYSQWLQGYHDSLWVVLYDSSISLYVWFCIHIGYLYHDSLWVVSMWFFNFALCFCIHIDYRGILLLREMSQCDSSNSLCVWFSHWLQGYRDSSWVVSMWFFKFALSMWFCIHIVYRGVTNHYKLSLNVCAYILWLLCT